MTMACGIWLGVAASAASRTTERPMALHELSNDAMRIAFSDDARLRSLSHVSGKNLLVTATVVPPMWELQFAGIDPKAAAGLTKVSLPQGAQSASLDNFTVTPNGATLDTVSLWAVTLAVGGIGSAVSAVSPVGLGTSTHGALIEGASYYGLYPSSQAAMQWLAAGVSDSGGVYFGAHDSDAHAKVLSWAVTNATHDARGLAADVDWGVRIADGRGVVASDGLGAPSSYGCRYPLVPPTAAYPAPRRAPVRTIALAISAVVAGAGGALSTSYVLPFALAVGATAGVAPLWYEAAQLYRRWAVIDAGASWVRDGPIDARPHVFPEWLLRTHVWVNSGWQCYDRFNVTQGDPPTVLARAAAFAARLGLGERSPSGPLALHWYEWQCGFSHLCANLSAERFRFDTQYPDYFPARRGDGFTEAVVALREKHGVRTLPYINARIFDEQSHSYADPAAGPAVCSHVPERATVGASGGTLCNEFYGSYELNGSKAVFAIADPTSAYWQSKYANTVSRLMGHHRVDGVYLDQLGAAAPLLNWHGTPAHEAGGGAWWRDGVVGILAQARKAAGGVAALVTESNSESVIDQASGLLTIAAMSAASLVQQLPASAPIASHVVPAFATIYGGYYVAFGNIFSASDLAPNPDVFAARLAGQFVYGIQLGWFSLGGVTHGPKFDKKCGPMGLGELLAEAKHDAEVGFIRLLARARATMARYLVHGRLVRPILVSPTPQTFESTGAIVRDPGPFPSLFTAVWAPGPQPDGHGGDSAVKPPLVPSSVCVLLVACVRAPVAANFTLDTADYFGASVQARLTLIGADGRRTPIGTTSSRGQMNVSRMVAGRSVQMLELARTDM